MAGWAAGGCERWASDLVLVLTLSACGRERGAPTKKVSGCAWEGLQGLQRSLEVNLEGERRILLLGEGGEMVHAVGDGHSKGLQFHAFSCRVGQQKSGPSSDMLKYFLGSCYCPGLHPLI